MTQVWNWLIRAAGALAMLGISAIGAAAPFEIVYLALVTKSSFPEIVDNLGYHVILVVDNGGSSAINQTWTGSNLKCVIFQMNVPVASGGGGPPVSFTQDLTATSGSLSIAGSITTGSGGALTSNFTDVHTTASPPAGTFSASGFAPLPNISWFLNAANPVFIDQSQFAPPTQRSFSDLGGGVQMTVLGDWTNPQPFSGSCGSGSTTTPGKSTAVPALNEWTVTLLALLLAISGFALMRRGR